MSKKLAIVGRGTAGALAVAHFLSYSDYEIDWYFDESIPTQAVGEGSTLSLPRLLFRFCRFNYDMLAYELDGTYKHGIKKQNWSKGKEYTHFFPPPDISFHFNALKLQEFILREAQKNKRLTVHQSNIISYDDIDADYIMDCTGKPQTYEDFTLSDRIAVNSVHVTQCLWDRPKFFYTGTVARKYGWVFVIPLQNRCSVGYLYNNQLNSLDEIKKDVEIVFEDYNLTPSDMTNSFSFNNYYRKVNFTERVCYNGNASFFLEPLEATSIGTMDVINRLTFDHLALDARIFDINFFYTKELHSIENMIGFHYYHGSIFKTEFWKMAKLKGKQAIKNLSVDNFFKEKIIANIDDIGGNLATDYGSWGPYSWKQNINGLGFDISKLLKV